MKPVFVNQLYNDLGFLVGNRLLIMLEAQSKWSKNIVFRMLLYLAWTWDTYVKIHHLDIYGSGDLRLPKPERIKMTYSTSTLPTAKSLTQ